MAIHAKKDCGYQFWEGNEIVTIHILEVFSRLESSDTNIFTFLFLFFFAISGGQAHCIQK